MKGATLLLQHGFCSCHTPPWSLRWEKVWKYDFKGSQMLVFICLALCPLCDITDHLIYFRAELFAKWYMWKGGSFWLRSFMGGMPFWCMSYLKAPVTSPFGQLIEIWIWLMKACYTSIALGFHSGICLTHWHCWIQGAWLVTSVLKIAPVGTIASSVWRAFWTCTNRCVLPKVSIYCHICRLLWHDFPWTWLRIFWPYIC